MAWPPPVLPVNRTNATPQLDTHAQDHNTVNLAINDLVAMINTGLSYTAMSYNASGPAVNARVTVTPPGSRIDGFVIMTAILYAANVNKDDLTSAVWGTLGGGSPDSLPWASYGQVPATVAAWTPIGSLSGGGPTTVGAAHPVTIGVNSSHANAANCYVAARVLWQYTRPY